MLDGGYYRSLANEQAAMQKASTEHENERLDPKYDESASEDENPDQNAGKEQNVTSSDKAVDYKSQYRFLKRKLKFLIYENEFFQDALRSNQRRLLKVSRDRAFLLDRLLQYEKPENTSSESEETESSEDEIAAKRRKLQDSSVHNLNENGGMRGRKKKTNANINSNEQQMNAAQITSNLQSDNLTHPSLILDTEIELEEEPQCHISAAEVERHLQAKQPIIDLLSERAPATVPTEMFSMEQSLDNLHPI